MDVPRGRLSLEPHVQALDVLLLVLGVLLLAQDGLSLAHVLSLVLGVPFLAHVLLLVQDDLSLDLGLVGLYRHRDGNLQLLFHAIPLVSSQDLYQLLG